MCKASSSRSFWPERYLLTLSHLIRWGETKDEATFQSFSLDPAARNKGHQKVRDFCHTIRKFRPDILWLWIDSCCMDQSNYSETSDAISQMFNWYRNVLECFAFLADVYSRRDVASSEWFRRGWTLQELLAPTTVVFLDYNWRVIGHKLGDATPAMKSVRPYREGNLNSTIAHITQIPRDVLKDVSATERYDVLTVLSWVRDRETREPEDLIYCMQGLLGAHMRPIRGEGIESAFRRLLTKLKDTGRLRTANTIATRTDYSRATFDTQDRSVRDATTHERFHYQISDGELVRVSQSGHKSSLGPATRQNISLFMGIRDEADDDDDDIDDAENDDANSDLKSLILTEKQSRARDHAYDEALRKSQLGAKHNIPSISTSPSSHRGPTAAQYHETQTRPLYSTDESAREIKSYIVRVVTRHLVL